MYRPNSLKARLEAGENIYGAWVGSGSPGNAELLGHVGFDFLVLDQEHGAGELADAVNMPARRGVRRARPAWCAHPGTTRSGSSASSMPAPSR